MMPPAVSADPRRPLERAVGNLDAQVEAIPGKVARLSIVGDEVFVMLRAFLVVEGV